MTTKITPNPCTLLRSNPHPGTGTVLVLGTPRGGTSVVAGACHLLGVSMGRSLDNSNLEDNEFREVLDSHDIEERAAAYFGERVKGNSIIGVKSPVIIDHLSRFYKSIENPILVVVSRDVYATAQREEISGSEFLSSLKSVVQRKYAILDFVQKTSDPLIVLSYERLLLDPLLAIRSLMEFLFGAADPELVTVAASMVRPHADMPNDVDFVAARESYERLLSSLPATVI